MLCRRAIILNRGRIAAQEDLANLPDGRTLEEVFLAAISSEAEAVA
jgi:hypothetical protein